MARLGIDFGTTNTVVVCADRGRFPVVPHRTDTAIGHVIRDVFPSLLAYDHQSGALVYGADAERCLIRPGAEERYSPIRSIKRLLRDYVGGGRIGHDVRPDGFDTAMVLRGLGEALRHSVQSAGLFAATEPLEAVVTWPASANGAQRYVTRTCFKEAGFDIIGTLNEPSAAAIEFADRVARGKRAAARQVTATVVIFDLGGGTFDASLVGIAGTDFTVVDTIGIDDLGGDDFDAVLARQFARALKTDVEGLPRLQRELLLRHACHQKESIASGSVRTLALVPADIGLEGAPCTVSVATYFKDLTPVITPAVDAVWSLVHGDAARAAGVRVSRLDAIYLVGGSSKLPVVSSLLAKRFPGLRLLVTDKPFTATAMGAAIHAAERVTMRDILSRHFGVIRLADHGRHEYFAPIFPAGMRLPARGAPPAQLHVEYTPRHNIGHLRYFECAGVDRAGQPAAGTRAWSDVLFPYDPQIPVDRRVTAADISDRSDLDGHAVCETYTCDSDGVISVRVRRSSDGQSRVFEIFRP
jgi:molecular chaperone DnaK (HSP70)